VRVTGKAVWGALLLLVLAAPAAASPRHGHSRKADTFVAAHLSSSDSLPVIITTRPGSRDAVSRRLEAHGKRIAREHSLIDAIATHVTAEDVALLEKDSDVETISIDADVAPSASSESTSYTDTSVVTELKQELGIANWFTGSSLTIAIIDSGIASNGDFSGRILGSYDFTNGGGGVSILPSDEYGHGTHVAGLVGASGALSSGIYAGIAPGIKFISLKVLDKGGAGRTSDVISAVQFAVANKDSLGIRIINLSLGHPIYESATTDPLVRAVEAAVRAGIVVVVAGGNYGTNPSTERTGYAGITSPGNSPSALTVGASTSAHTVTRQDDRVEAYSSRGPSWFDGYAKPDVVAPGQDLISDEVDGSTLATTYPWLVVQGSNGKFLRLSGSSMAAGVVSGLVAMMIEAHDYAAYQQYQSSGKLKKTVAYVPPPPLAPNAIKAMLQYSATPLRDANGVRYDALTQGTGEVDGRGALTLAYYADTSKAAGSWWLGGTVTPGTQYGDTYEAWSQEIVWGTRVFSGASLIEINQPAWQTATVWGAGELDNVAWCTVDDGDNIVWGTSISLPDVVWAGSVDGGDNIVWGTSSWAQAIVWGADLVGYVDDGDNIVWGTSVDDGDNIVWGTSADDGDNIVWGTLEDLDLVWGSATRVIVLRGGQ
jgi:serine protease AprX